MILQGDCRAILPTLDAESVDCCVTSPPYFGLRDYGVDGQIGLEVTPEAYVAEMVAVFREVRRVLKDAGTLWLNLGDSYNTYSGNRRTSEASLHRPAAIPVVSAGFGLSDKGLKYKDLIGIPWRVAFALQADGWYLRQDIVWHKPNPMPESVTDRCTKAHEYVFLLSKSPRYHFDSEAIRVQASTSFSNDRRHLTGSNQNHDKTGFDEAGAQDSKGPHRIFGKSGNKARKPATERGCPNEGVAGNVPWGGMTANRRSVWTVATRPLKLAHFATFPPALVEPMILAGCRPGGVVLDPFSGAGTVALEAGRFGRKSIGIELNPDYVEIQKTRITSETAQLFG